jgi:hypothetical protein
MQPTTYLHDGIASPVLQQAVLVFHNPIAFSSANRVMRMRMDERHNCRRASYSLPAPLSSYQLLSLHRGEDTKVHNLSGSCEQCKNGLFWCSGVPYFGVIDARSSFEEIICTGFECLNYSHSPSSLR